MYLVVSKPYMTLWMKAFKLSCVGDKIFIEFSVFTRSSLLAYYSLDGAGTLNIKESPYLNRVLIHHSTFDIFSFAI